VFIDEWVYLALNIMGMITMGFTNVLVFPYWATSRFATAFLNLYWANAIYEAFHPVVAPEILQETTATVVNAVTN
jgi:hypothetical protein